MADPKAAAEITDRKGEQVQERKVAPAGPSSLHQAEHQRVGYFMLAAKGVHPSDLLKPDYWAHVSAKLKPRDRIEVWAEDGTWMVEAVVLDASRAFARVFPVVGPHFLTTSDVAQSLTVPPGFEIMHRGPKKWSVVRTSNREVLHESEQTKGGAEQWLKDNADRLKATA